MRPHVTNGKRPGVTRALPCKDGARRLKGTACRAAWADEQEMFVLRGSTGLMRNFVAHIDQTLSSAELLRMLLLLLPPQKLSCCFPLQPFVAR